MHSNSGLRYHSTSSLDGIHLLHLVSLLSCGLLRSTDNFSGVPHASVKDDVYRGYFIPGKSIVLNNIWHVSIHPFRELLRLSLASQGHVPRFPGVS